MVLSPQYRTTSVPSTSTIHLLKADDLIVAGYASVEMVDKQGDMITRSALKDAFGNFMKAEGFRNVQLAHSNIQVGEVIPDYTDADGKVWKSGVDDAGMFVVIRLRGDIEKAREVAAEIRKGNMRGFSIGGQAFKRMRKSDTKHGDYTEISKLELHEVTICEKGINPEATFRILKEDTSMTEENDAMSDLSNVLDRLSKRLDDMEKGDAPFPPKAAEDEKPKDEDKEDDNGDDEKKNPFAKGEYSDTITHEYLNWMEDTLKSAGINTNAARQHFEDVAKGYGKGEDGATHAGQVPGRATEGGKPEAPKANFGGGGKGSKSVAKGFLHPSDVSAADIESAYEVYKNAEIERRFKGNLGEVFADRLQKELREEAENREASNFDARGPLSEIQKAIESLSERIDNISTAPAETGVEIRKSNNLSNIEIPSTEDLGSMDWADVHALAGSVWN